MTWVARLREVLTECRRATDEIAIRAGAQFIPHPPNKGQLESFEFSNGSSLVKGRWAAFGIPRDSTPELGEPTIGDRMPIAHLSQANPNRANVISSTCQRFD